MSLSVRFIALGEWMLRAGLFFLATACAMLPARAGDAEKWVQVPASQSGIAIYFSSPTGDLSLTATDSKGQALDKYEWSSPGLPLVRQYRVPPGEYHVKFDGLPTLTTDAKAGKISYIEVKGEPVSGVFTASVKSDFDPYKSGVIGAVEVIGEKLGPESIKPRELAPAGNDIYIAMAGPGVKPPPK